MHYLLFILLIAATPNAATASISAKDFFCKKVPIKLPEFFTAKVKGCGKNEEISQMNICVEYSYCTYISEETKNKRVKSASGHEIKIKDLPEAEKTKYINQITPLTSWLPSTLTCEKKSPISSNECPTLEKCKGDINFGWAQGAYAKEDEAYYQSTTKELPGAFQNDPSEDAQ